MSKNILEIDNIKNLNNLNHIFNDNNLDDNYPVKINKKSTKSFNDTKRCIKDNYINKVKSIYDKKIKGGTLDLTEFILFGMALICIFNLIFLMIAPLNGNTGHKYLGLPFITLIFFPLIYKFLPPKYLEFFVNSNKIKNKEEEIIDNIEYFLPMSKERLNFITKNNIDLRNYIINNPQICHSQYSIDKALGKKCAFEDYLNDDIKELFDSTYSVSLELNDVDTSTLNQTLLLEQSNLLPLNESDIIMKDFKVIYAIEHGPERSIIFKHSHKDEKEFESYINSFVENNYKRKCNMLSVEEI